MKDKTRSTVFWYSDVQSAASKIILEAKQYPESEWEIFIKEVALAAKAEIKNERRT